MHEEILEKLLNSQQRYFVVETLYTEHHLERLAGTVKDRGRWKWIAESKQSSWNDARENEEARRSHVDGGDLFPRLYFNNECLIKELLSWLEVRNLKITDIRTPKL